MQEIEIKSLLTKDKYNELKQILPQKFKKIEEDTITTVRFRPKDIRVRYSDKINELIFKDGNPTSLSRKEIVINLKDLDNVKKMIKLLKELKFKDDPSWIKKKKEFICEYNGNNYTLSLQHIKNFAYLLEIEIMSDEKDKELHISNFKKILNDFECKPIDASKFKLMIEEYIKNYSNQ